MSTFASQPAPNAGSSGCTAIEATLETIDRVLWRTALEHKLASQLSPEPPSVRGDEVFAHHPDCQAVWRLCLERHPEWTEFPEQTVRVVVSHLLHDREATAQLRRICGEPPQLAARVLNRLAELSPDGSDEDGCWVWHELARRYPGTPDYDFNAPQIVAAWKMVRIMRRRHDHTGLGGPRPEARRQRRLTLARFGKELGCSTKTLLRLDIDDYDPFEATLALNRGRAPAVLSAAGQCQAAKWLRLRGRGPGGLFELPQLPEFWEGSLSERPCWEPPPARGAPGGADVETEDVIESLCHGQPALVCAFVLGNLVDRGGDWSAAFVELLTASCGLAAQHSFTGYEPSLPPAPRPVARRLERVFSSPWRSHSPNCHNDPINPQGFGGPWTSTPHCPPSFKQCFAVLIRGRRGRCGNRSYLRAFKTGSLASGSLTGLRLSAAL